MASPNNISVNEVRVNLGARSYSIQIGSGLLGQLGPSLAKWLQSEHAIIVSDDNVAKIYLDDVVNQISEMASRTDTLVVPPGEPSKSVSQCDQLWQKMVELSTDRQSVVIALGGGVVGDLAGFLAATFARGLRFIQIPTSLLAQVDSSVGGKVGINLPQSKNMVGAFWQPESVIIDPRVLTTLDEANYRAGLAEVIKYGVIMDVDLFEFLESSVTKINQRDSETLEKIIAWCCRCKSTIVTEDETETTGRRAILNYGHTLGHAIETVYGYGQYLHGEAIAIGMTCAARLARDLGQVGQKFLDRQSDLFQAVGLSTDCPTDRHQDLIDAMYHDKKVSRGKLILILPTDLGCVELVDAPDAAALLQSLKND